MPRFIATSDFGAGVVFALCGAAAWWFSSDLPLGTAAKMGPAYMPRLLSGILILFGIGLIGRSALQSGPTLSWPQPRPLAAILAAVGVFAFAVERLGLALAIILLVVIAGLGSADLRKREVAGAAVILTALCIALFIFLLDLPIAVLPRFLVQ